MVTHYEYALFSKLAYFPQEARFNVPKGWEMVSHTSDYLGYQAVTFMKGRNIVIAHSGTDNPQDMISNFLIYLKAIPTQAITAINYSYEIKAKFGKEFTYSHTGHSLGGAIAELIALKTETEAVSFDAPGIKAIASKEVSSSQLAHHKITSYVSAPNIVNTAGKHVSPLIMLTFKTDIQPGIRLEHYLRYSLDQHKIDNIINALDQPENSIATKSWPKSFAAGYEHFTSYKHNKDYLDEFLKQAWDTNPRSMEVVSKLKLLPANPLRVLLPVKAIFTNFDEFQKHMIKNELTGESSNLVSLENRINKALESLKENEFIKVAQDIFSGIFELSSLINDARECLNEDANLSGENVCNEF